jgi:DNA-binding CsgD family transcriptional regulator
MAGDQLKVTESEHLALLREIASLGTQSEIFRFLQRLTEEFGLRGFMVLRMPDSTRLELGFSSIITNYPTEVVTAYDRAKLMKDSRAYQKVLASTLPFTFDVDALYDEENDPRMEGARQIFHCAKLGRGAVFPVSDASGERGAIVLSGDRPELDASEILVLHMVAAHVFDRLFQIRHKDCGTAACLTDREIECLGWTSAGKTSAEIAEILGLSEHTVNHYLNRAARKLDSVNRTQAVAKALRSGIIR